MTWIVLFLSGFTVSSSFLSWIHRFIVLKKFINLLGVSWLELFSFSVDSPFLPAFWANFALMLSCFLVEFKCHAWFFLQLRKLGQIKAIHSINFMSCVCSLVYTNACRIMNLSPYMFLYLLLLELQVFRSQSICRKNSWSTL